MDLKALYAKGRKIEFEFDGQKGSVTYNPDMATRKHLKNWADKLQALQDGDDDSGVLDMVDEQLAELVRAWDLTAGEEPIPITRESIAELPIQLKQAIRTAIYGDNGEEAKKGKRTSSMTG